jgi:hypothetical protein
MSMPDEIAPIEQAAAEPLSAALAHIERHGSLLRFAPERTQRLTLIKAMTAKGLITWNAMLRVYEVSELGRRYMAEQNDARRSEADFPAEAISEGEADQQETNVVPFPALRRRAS